MFNKEKLIKIMEEKDFSAYKLWKTSGVAQSTISSILTGSNTNPTTATLEKLAIALDVNLAEFFNIDDAELLLIQSKNVNSDKNYDEDIIRIERARKKMKAEDKENMMKILEAAFGKYFD